MTDPCRPNPSSPRPRSDDVTWTRSTHCGSGGCVEVALDDGVVLVRDSKLGDASPVQDWTPNEWCDLLAVIKSDSSYRTGVYVQPSGGVLLGLMLHLDLLRFDQDEWSAFTDGVEAGEFDLVRLLPGFKASSRGERSGDGGTSPAAAATGAGGGAVLPVPVAAQDLPDGSPAESPGCNPAPVGAGVLSLSATPSPPTSQGTNLQRAHAIVLSQLRGRASKIEQAEQIVADLHDAGLLVDDVAAAADDMLRQAAAPLVPIEPGGAPPDCGCWGCLAWRRGIVS